MEIGTVGMEVNNIYFMMFLRAELCPMYEILKEGLIA